MAKKTEKKYININEVNIEIDYDKLADAIVSAQNKQTGQYSVTREWMKMIVTPIFWGITIITGLLGAIFAWQGGKTFYEAMQPNVEEWMTTACIGGFGFIVGLFLIGLAILTGATSHEVNKEADKNFVVAVFSGIVSLVALAVSLIALVMGVS